MLQVRDTDEEDPFREKTVQLLDDFKISGVNGTRILALTLRLHTERTRHDVTLCNQPKQQQKQMEKKCPFFALRTDDNFLNRSDVRRFQTMCKMVFICRFVSVNKLTRKRNRPPVQKKKKVYPHKKRSCYRAILGVYIQGLFHPERGQWERAPRKQCVCCRCTTCIRVV